MTTMTSDNKTKSGLILPLDKKEILLPSSPHTEIVPKPREWSRFEQLEIWWLMEMLRGPAGIAAVLGLYGLPRSGKTTFLVWLMYKLRKYFGMRSIIDSPYLKPLYGDYTLMMDRDFIRELRRIYKITERYQAEHRLKDLTWEAIGTILYQACFGWDEAYSKISHRMVSKNKLSEAYLDFIMQYGHYQCVILIATPKQELIDLQKAQFGITHDVHCSCSFVNGKVITTYNIYNRATKQFFTKRLDVLKWSKLYDSYGVIVPRSQFINFKGLGFNEEEEEEEKAELEAQYKKSAGKNKEVRHG